MQIDTLLMFINILNSHFFCSYYIKWLAGMKLIVSLQRALKSIIGFNVNSNVIKFRIEFNFLNVYNLSNEILSHFVFPVSNLRINYHWTRILFCQQLCSRVKIEQRISKYIQLVTVETMWIHITWANRRHQANCIYTSLNLSDVFWIHL